MFQIIFIKVGFGVVEILTANNKNNDDDYNGHSLHQLRTCHMLDTVPSTLHVLSLNFTVNSLGRLVSILKIRTLRQSYVK